MKRCIRPLLWCAVLGGIAVMPTLARAQRTRSQRGQPRTPFGLADFARFHWLEGAWVATAPGERTFYERWHFTSDSTVEITYYADSTLSRATGNGRVYLTVGRVYQTFGPNRWGATHIDSAGAYFIPQVNAHNSFEWTFQSPDAWTATMRSGFTGHDRVTVYQMRRIGPRPDGVGATRR